MIYPLDRTSEWIHVLSLPFYIVSYCTEELYEELQPRHRLEQESSMKSCVQSLRNKESQMSSMSNRKLRKQQVRLSKRVTLPLLTLTARRLDFGLENRLRL